MKTGSKTILYFGIVPPDKSMRDVPYLKALKVRGVRFIECFDGSRGLKKYIELTKKFFSLREKFDVVWVGHTSALAVPLIWLLTRKPIIFNALCPQYDGNVIDRETYAPYSPYAMMIWLLDFVSLNLPKVVLLETNAQIANVRKTFFVPEKKLYRIYTTVDPEIYHPNHPMQKPEKFTCMFRAWMTPATGTEYIVEAVRLLKSEDIVFKFFVKGPLTENLKKIVEREKLPIEVDTRFYEFEDLVKNILSCHVYLGQFSDHVRTTRTIQFKTVEAMAFGLPYITADLPSNRELLSSGVNCLFVKPRDPKDLAEKILTLKNDATLRETLGREAYALYQRELEPRVLVKKILAIINGLLKR